MASMTPVRIRGKRNAPKEQKWHVGKQRKALRPNSTSISEGSSSARSTPSAGAESRRRRKKREPELSQLEQLPTEVIQVIFEYSANLELPLASPRLASQLATKHLHHSLTSIALQPVLDGNVPTDGEIRAALRLMNSNFFTWPFFQTWLQEQFEQRQLLPKYEALFEYGEEDVTVDNHQERWTWYELTPFRLLPPPLKLLHGPFTQERIEFLRCTSEWFRPELAEVDEIDPLYLEAAREGLQHAVSEGAHDALRALWSFGMQPDTELLRLAVVDCGCDKQIVYSLISHGTSVFMRSAPVAVDFLDPMLWSWAEKAQANGNDKGSWLKDKLKFATRLTNRNDTESKQTRSTS